MDSLIHKHLSKWVQVGIKPWVCHSHSGCLVDGQSHTQTSLQVEIKPWVCHSHSGCLVDGQSHTQTSLQVEIKPWVCHSHSGCLVDGQSHTQTSLQVEIKPWVCHSHSGCLVDGQSHTQTSLQYGYPKVLDGDPRRWFSKCYSSGRLMSQHNVLIMLKHPFVLKHNWNVPSFLNNRTDTTLVSGKEKSFNNMPLLEKNWENIDQNNDHIYFLDSFAIYTDQRQKWYLILRSNTPLNRTVSMTRQFCSLQVNNQPFV